MSQINGLVKVVIICDHICSTNCIYNLEKYNSYDGKTVFCRYDICQKQCYSKIKDTGNYKTLDVLKEILIASLCHIECFGGCPKQEKFDEICSSISVKNLWEPVISELIKICTKLTFNREKILLNPALGGGEYKIPSDCDIVIDNTLIDIKCTISAKFKDKKNILQLLGYSALLYYSKYKISIKNVCIFNILDGIFEIYSLNAIDNENFECYLKLLTGKYDDSKNITKKKSKESQLTWIIKAIKEIEISSFENYIHGLSNYNGKNNPLDEESYRLKLIRKKIGSSVFSYYLKNEYDHIDLRDYQILRENGLHEFKKINKFDCLGFAIQNACILKIIESNSFIKYQHIKVMDLIEKKRFHYFQYVGFELKIKFHIHMRNGLLIRPTNKYIESRDGNIEDYQKLHLSIVPDRFGDHYILHKKTKYTRFSLENRDEILRIRPDMKNWNQVTSFRKYKNGKIGVNTKRDPSRYMYSTALINWLKKKNAFTSISPNFLTNMMLKNIN